MTPVWTDKTSYSRNEPNRVPRTWVLALPIGELVVTKYIGQGDAWFYECRDMNISRRELASRDLNEARMEAQRRLMVRISELRVQFNDVEKLFREGK